MTTSKRDSLRVLFAGGGTGGHLMPGAATAEALRLLVPSSRSLFIVTERRTERQCLPALAGFETARVPAGPAEGVLGSICSAAGPALTAARFLDAVRLFGPDVVVGLGGHRSIGPVILARAAGIRTVVFESNAVAGRAVRLLAPLADRTILQWDCAAVGLRARRVLVAGNPVRPRLFGVEREAARRRLGLLPGKLTLLVIGGSQGARALNHMLHEALATTHSRGGDLQVLHLTGVDHLPAALEWLNSRSVTSYRPIGFLNQMEDAYAAADFVLARAGGSTLAELTALGLPSILVPYPHAANNHQTANAAVLGKAGASLVIGQHELSQERLADVILELAGDALLRTRMADCARRLGRPEAALTVATELAALAGFTRWTRPSLPVETTLPHRFSRAA